jgi:hypothetical protein
MYNIVQTMGKTNLGGVMGALIHSYHGELMDFRMTPLGKNMTITITTKANK